MFHQQVLNDLKIAMKSGDTIKRDTLRFVVAEFQRKSNPHEEIQDTEVLSIINKLIKSERELLKAKQIMDDNDYIKVLNNYLPETPSEESVKTWIVNNCEKILETPKNQRNKFMSKIMEKYKGIVDGKTIQTYLSKLDETDK